MPIFDDKLTSKFQGTKAPTPVSSPRASAVERAPLKARTTPSFDHVNLSFVETPASPVTQPYNPYPARRASALSTQPPSTIETVGLFALVAIFVITGALVLSSVFAKTFVEKQVTRAIHKAVAPYAETAVVEFSGVTVSLLHPSVQIRNIEITLPETSMRSAQTVSIARLKVWGLDWNSLKLLAQTRHFVLPQTAKVAADGVHVPAGAFGAQAQSVLEGMGYAHFTLSLSGEFSRTANSINFENFQLSAPHVGQLALSLALGDLNLPSMAQISRWKKDPRLLLSEGAQFTKTTVRGFDLNFTDATLTNRITNAFTRMGETPPLELAQMALQVNGGSRDPAARDFVRTALQTVVRFLQKPESISFSAHPDTGVSLASLVDEKMGSVNELAQKLNLTIE